MKKGHKRLAAILTAALFGSLMAGCGSEEPPKKVGEVTASAPAKEAEPSQTAKEPEKSEFRVGDMLTAEGLEIVYVSSGEYVSGNQFLQPKDGCKFIYIELACKNVAESDKNISFYSFECYADGYAADSYYGGEDALSATMSAGRTTAGKVYFEVPVDAEEIEIEYKYNLFSDKKAHFIYEGAQESGYIAPADASASEEAYKVGDVIETSGVTISYLSCEDYTSDNMFIQPAEGNQYVSCEFEFENTSESEQMISGFNFKCYADGKACEASYLRDNALGTTTLSVGRKVKGTVTFEVPTAADVVELEYETNVWTSDHIVFTVK